MKKRAKTFCALCLFFVLAIGPVGIRIQPTHAQDSSVQDDAENSKDKPSHVPGRILVGFKPNVSKKQTSMLMSAAGARTSKKIPQTGVHIVELPEFADEEAYLEAFRARPEVEFAELDIIVPVQELIPNDLWYSSEWHLPKISAPSAWSMNTGSSSVTIAICDTGVDVSHPDLAPKVVPGWNVYNNNSDTSDVHGHGTQVAGAAASCSNNGIGVASVAWGCSIMPIRISDASGNATYSAMANGITWAADHGARVANVSYIATNSSTVKSAAQYMQTKGGVVTVSAGNYSTFDSAPDNPYVLTVSATNMSDALSEFSNYGNNVDLAAPEAVYTTTRGGGYSYQGGTSFSAPIVAGVAALVLSSNPNLTGAQVQDILKQNADDLGNPGWDSSYGWGRINAAHAVNAVSGGGTQDTMAPTVGFSSPTNGSAVSGTVSVQVTAGDNVGVSSVSVTVDGTLLGADSVSPYTFSWNTTSVSNGSHTLRATANDAAGNAATTSITVTVSNTVDTTPPTVTIMSPANGATVSNSISVLVNATDNVAVVKVELYVDGGLTSTSTSSPFTTKWNAKRVAKGAHTVQTKAYDAKGNVGLSQAVTVYR